MWGKDRNRSTLQEPISKGDLLTTTWTGNSEGQEAASTAASEEAGQANLLRVTWWHLMLDFEELCQEFKLPRTRNKSAVTSWSQGLSRCKQSLMKERPSLRKKAFLTVHFFNSVNCMNSSFNCSWWVSGRLSVGCDLLYKIHCILYFFVSVVWMDHAHVGGGHGFYIL